MCIKYMVSASVHLPSIFSIASFIPGKFFLRVDHCSVVKLIPAHTTPNHTYWLVDQNNYTMFEWQYWREKNRREGEGREGKRREERWKGNTFFFVWEGMKGKGREMVPFKSFQLWRDWNLTKKYLSNRSNSLPSKSLSSYFAIKIRDFSSFQVSSFYFSPKFLPSKHAL